MGSFARRNVCNLAWENSRHYEMLPLGFPAKWGLRNERRNSILMTRHYPDMSSASDWLNQISHAARPIIVTRHHYGISALVSQTSLAGKPVVAWPNVCCFLRLSATQRQKFHTDDLNQCVHNISGSHGVQIQICSMLHFSWSILLKCWVHLRKSPNKTQMLLLIKEDYIPQL